MGNLFDILNPKNFSLRLLHNWCHFPIIYMALVLERSVNIDRLFHFSLCPATSHQGLFLSLDPSFLLRLLQGCASRLPLVWPSHRNVHASLNIYILIARDARKNVLCDLARPPKCHRTHLAINHIMLRMNCFVFYSSRSDNRSSLQRMLRFDPTDWAFNLIDLWHRQYFSPTLSIVHSISASLMFVSEYHHLSVAQYLIYGGEGPGEPFSAAVVGGGNCGLSPIFMLHWFVNLDVSVVSGQWRASAMEHDLFAPPFIPTHSVKLAEHQHFISWPYRSSVMRILSEIHNTQAKPISGSSLVEFVCVCVCSLETFSDHYPHAENLLSWFLTGISIYRSYWCQTECHRVSISHPVQLNHRNFFGILLAWLMQ